MQVWIGTGATQDISYEYDTNTIGQDAPRDPTTPDVSNLRIGAESVSGASGNQITGPPTGSYR